MMKTAIFITALVTVAFITACSDSKAEPELEPTDALRVLTLLSLVDQVRAEDELEPGRVTTEIIEVQEGIGVGDSNAVVIEDDGLYSVTLSPQSGKRAGCGRYWMSVNDEAVPASAVQICQSCPTLTSSSTVEVNMPLVEGDVITFWQTGELGVQATIPEALNEPAVPSVRVTVVGVSDEGEVEVEDAD